MKRTELKIEMVKLIRNLKNSLSVGREERRWEGGVGGWGYYRKIEGGGGGTQNVRGVAVSHSAWGAHY